MLWIILSLGTSYQADPNTAFKCQLFGNFTSSSGVCIHLVDFLPFPPIKRTFVTRFALVLTLSIHIIMKTCLYNFDPLKPHFFIVKLGFTGVDSIFLFLLKNIECGYSLEPPRRGGSNEYPQSMFWAETWKISAFFIWKFSFFGGKIFSIFE